MAKDKTEKTNVMRLLEQKKLPYTPHDYLASGAVSGVEVAAALGEPPERVFKTLVTTGASGGHFLPQLRAATPIIACNASRVSCFPPSVKGKFFRVWAPSAGGTKEKLLGKVGRRRHVPYAKKSIEKICRRRQKKMTYKTSACCHKQQALVSVIIPPPAL